MEVENIAAAPSTELIDKPWHTIEALLPAKARTGKTKESGKRSGRVG